jgi:predicted dehydrogenase
MMRRTKRKLRAGVIGTGMGRFHMEGFATHPGSELVAVCDLNVEEAREFADRYGAKHVFRDYREMVAMEELDLVSVVTPNNLHAAMTLAALRAGKDVLCEKPMAIRLSDAEAMVREARRRKKRLMINVGMRFNPLHQEVQARVAGGDLGDVYYAKSHWIRRKGIPFADFPPTGDMARGEWFVERRKAGGGASVDIGVHLYDLVWWLIGSPKPTCVLASTYSELLPDRLAKVGVKGDVDDLAAAFVKFKTGQTLFVEVTWDAHQPPYLGYEIFGTEAGAVWANWENTATLYCDTRSGKPTQKTVRAAGKVPSSYWHFVDCCLDRRKKMIAAGEELLEVTRVLDGIARSQRTKKAVDL